MPFRLLENAEAWLFLQHAWGGHIFCVGILILASSTSNAGPMKCNKSYLKRWESCGTRSRPASHGQWTTRGGIGFHFLAVLGKIVFRYLSKIYDIRPIVGGSGMEVQTMRVPSIVSQNSIFVIGVASPLNSEVWTFQQFKNRSIGPLDTAGLQCYQRVPSILKLALHSFFLFFRVRVLEWVGNRPQKLDTIDISTTKNLAFVFLLELLLLAYQGANI